MSRVLKERSISCSSGDVVLKELADVVVSGLEVFEDGCELLSEDVSVVELSVPLVLVLSALELPDGELGKDTEDSLMVVIDTGCCSSHVCLIGMSRSGSVTSSLNFLLFVVEMSCLGCLLGGTLTVLL